MKSPLAYVGGKSILSREIAKMIPEHKTYCEAFAGAGWVFFRKEPSDVEVLNDLDSDLVSFYRVLQNHLEEFLKQFKWLLTSREVFDDWKNQIEGRGLTDIQKAARYFYLQRLCFGGRVKNRSFGVEVDDAPRINLLRIEEELSHVHLRLVGVTIENLDWKEFIARYDRTETFFYLDPPYYLKPCYKHNFEGINSFVELKDTLRDIKGKFILSLNDHPEIRNIFNDFKVRPVKLNYSVSKEKVTQGEELIISNFQEEKGNELFDFEDLKDEGTEGT
ncbi:MAG: DNA adenine methylase [bacterium]|nr:DNA adenine methylase [bacterium]